MLTGGDNVMPTTEDMNAKLPPVVPPSVTDLVTGKNPREFSADFGQQVGEVAGLGKAPGMAAKGVAAGVRTLSPTAKQMAERIAGKVGNSFRNYVVPYENAPDNLMGFPKDKPTKSFWDQKYSFVQFVRVKWADGMEIVDAVKGVNGPQAMERARRNWNDAEEILPLSKEEAFKADPELKSLMESMGEVEKPRKRRAKLTKEPDGSWTIEQDESAVKAAKKRRAKIRKEPDGSWTIEQDE
jgi:hypothetical protein